MSKLGNQIKNQESITHIHKIEPSGGQSDELREYVSALITTAEKLVSKHNL